MLWQLTRSTQRLCRPRVTSGPSKAVADDSEVIWAESDKARSGYKWGKSNGSVKLRSGG